MSDIGVSYDIHYAPNPVACTARLELSGTDINVALDNFPPLQVGLVPHYSANILSDMVSTIGTPLVNVIANFLSVFAGQFINGKRIKVGSIPAIPYTVEGTSITLKPSKLSASDFGGSLKISGDFDIS
jgi:hypothetical protein